MTVDPSHVIIAIDGPAASGKSSVARALARKLRYVYINTGAMYRAVTWHAVEQQVPTLEPDKVVALLADTHIVCGLSQMESTITINGIDPTPFLSEEAVNRNVSNIATVPEVRRLLVPLQREYLADHDIVMEGRDIGSAVFPETPYKFYIDASAEVRALRRARQGLQDSIVARDKIDSTRRASPLIIAEDAHVIDSSNLTVEGVVGEIFGRLKQKGLPLGEL
ncbi:MAG TPA: (d)CMP kinase [Chthoniobacteraceae bacterium]|nr:cmk: cytidylate kinase [Chthoniobacter sp.]HEV7869138.1 (d)CMP kinase [Chthoniobacteraceae bacterium]